MAGHLPFALLNQTVNRGMKRLLRSSRHGLVSDRLLLLTYTGRKSGRSYSIPVRYMERAGGVTLVPSAPERKRWWRNLRGAGAPVTVVLRGKRRSGHAVAHGDERTGVRVDVELE